MRKCRIIACHAADVVDSEPVIFVRKNAILLPKACACLFPICYRFWVLFQPFSDHLLDFYRRLCFLNTWNNPRQCLPKSPVKSYALKNIPVFPKEVCSLFCVFLFCWSRTLEIKIRWNKIPGRWITIFVTLDAIIFGWFFKLRTSVLTCPHQGRLSPLTPMTQTPPPLPFPPPSSFPPSPLPFPSLPLSLPQYHFPLSHLPLSPPFPFPCREAAPWNQQGSGERFSSLSGSMHSGWI